MKLAKQENEQRKMDLANLFFEMGMDLELLEKVSGVQKDIFLNQRINNYKQRKDLNVNQNNIIIKK